MIKEKLSKIRLIFNDSLIDSKIELFLTLESCKPERLWDRWCIASGCLIVEFINISLAKSDLASVWLAPVLVLFRLLGGAIIFDCWLAVWTPFVLIFCCAAFLVASLISWNFSINFNSKKRIRENKLAMK